MKVDGRGHKNAWTSDEQRNFIRLIKLHGRDFKTISENLGKRRTQEACEKNANKMLKLMVMG